MEYNFRDIEKKWQQKWIENKVYQVSNHSSKPKYYVLDMFPYPSGAGLHVGHPLGYIASDIFARYKRLKGYNVLHPMGYDAFGLPAEQYAIEHGVHPAVSTEKNIATFRKQLDNIGFSFDWSREIRTSDPKYYKWTQWIFLQLFKSWYNKKTNKTEHIDGLVKIFQENGNSGHPIPDTQFQIPEYPHVTFTAQAWKSFTEKTQQAILMEYRIAYCGYGEVNWCEALGTVLANDEVINGVSERGGYPVEKKRLRQWYLRITEYADRLLEGLHTVDFSEAMKEMQSNWIGKSEGAEIVFRLTPGPSPSGEGSKEYSNKYFKTADVSNWQMMKEFGRTNRKNPTEAEDILWQNLRNHKLGVKVRRQHTIEGYIADFVIAEADLIIEVDGSYHDTEEQKSLDLAREQYLNQRGFILLRFTNEEVENDIRNVLKKIQQKINTQKEIKRKDASVPLLQKEKGLGDEAVLLCFTTRPDTIFGVDFLVLAPEHELVEKITTPEQKTSVEEYIAYVKSRSERERMAEKKITGVFTGGYAQHPFSEKQIPVWISEYVLAGYGTGAIMGVPSGDERDHKFAKHFNIPITNIAGAEYNGEEAYSSKELILENSDFLTGMNYDGAFEVVIKKLEEIGLGKRKINYKMRDAAFSRQRYWGEPFPIIWKEGIAYPLDESELPLELPHVESYKPGPEGEGPLANIEEFLTPGPSPSEIERGEGAASTKGVRETNTMPGYAGSSWYFLRYMDPDNEEVFCDKNISTYWNQVDLYVGGTEHAVGHLLYSRMWTKALYDLRLITFDEPFKKLLNQGMITGASKFVYMMVFTQNTDKRTENIFEKIPPIYVSKNLIYMPKDMEETFKEEGEGLKLRDAIHDIFKDFGSDPDIITDDYDFSRRRVNVKLTDGDYLDMLRFREDSELSRNAYFICGDLIVVSPKDNVINESAKYLCDSEVEKMSKSKLNAVSPYIPPVIDENGNKIKEADGIVEKYGADTFRMYEMFLGPVEMSKPWDTKGIEGVHRFLKKLWRLFYHDNNFIVTDEKASPEELKILHKTIKKIEEDTERFSFNTCVSAFMVCVNELTDLKCSKREILEPLLILLTPYAPHVAEELYQQLCDTFATGGARPDDTVGRGRDGASILDASFPQLEKKFLEETSKEYPISVNGKLRTTINIDLATEQNEVEEIVLQNAVIQKWLEGRQPKKIIFVKNKMVNVVI